MTETFLNVAGGNLAAAVVIRAIEEKVRVPDGLVLVYPALYMACVPSPSRLLTLIDPMLPLTTVRNCFNVRHILHFSIVVVLSEVLIRRICLEWKMLTLCKTPLFLQPVPAMMSSSLCQASSIACVLSEFPGIYFLGRRQNLHHVWNARSSAGRLSLFCQATRASGQEVPPEDLRRSSTWIFELVRSAEVRVRMVVVLMNSVVLLMPALGKR